MTPIRGRVRCARANVAKGRGASEHGSFVLRCVRHRTLHKLWMPEQLATLDANMSRRDEVTDSPATRRRNRLLAALEQESLDRIGDHLELVEIPLGLSLSEPHIPMDHVYFPINSIVSLLCLMENGESAEIAVVGFEGVLGISLFMGGQTVHSRAIVQSGGHAYRLPARILQEEFARGGSVQQLLLRYTQTLITQMAQTAACNRHHTLDQQLCRWLLLSHDRLVDDEVVMTQELIANMLGVRREGVTEAAKRLQRANLIEYRRGHITITDRPGLEARSCECYSIVEQEFDRLLPDPSARGEPH